MPSKIVSAVLVFPVRLNVYGRVHHWEEGYAPALYSYTNISINIISILGVSRVSCQYIIQHCIAAGLAGGTSKRVTLDFQMRFLWYYMNSELRTACTNRRRYRCTPRPGRGTERTVDVILHITIYRTPGVKAGSGGLPKVGGFMNRRAESGRVRACAATCMRSV